MPPAKLQPALFGGLFMGVLSALPFINLGNCCCLWVIGGGVLAAYVMQQNHPLPIAVADGALVGLIAGVFGAIIGTVLSIPIEMAFGDWQRQLAQRVIENMGGMPPDAEEMFDRYRAGGAAWGVMKMVTLMLGVVIGAVFGMLGGVLGASMFRRDQPPLPPPPTTLPPTTIVP
jgi:hypothetical protein